MIKPTCGTCVYWQTCSPIKSKKVYGDCRRKQPIDTEDLWPIVDPLDWCGEHQDFKAWLQEVSDEQS